MSHAQKRPIANAPGRTKEDGIDGTMHILWWECSLDTLFHDKKTGGAASSTVDISAMVKARRSFFIELQLNMNLKFLN